MKKTLKTTIVAALIGAASVVSAQSAPGLVVSVAAPPSVTTGTNQTIATIGLNANGGDVSLNALPISLGYSNPTGEPFSGCALRNTAGSAALNTGQNALGAQGSGDFTVTFDTPITVSAGATTVLFLTCNIPASVPNGNAVATSVFVSQVDATSGGDSVSVSGSDPQSGATNRPVATAIISSSAPSDPGPGAGGAPGLPNTGGGGAMIPALVSLATLIGAAVVGGYALRRAV